jgi:hypothetical protein
MLIGIFIELGLSLYHNYKYPEAAAIILVIRLSVVARKIRK